MWTHHSTCLVFLEESLLICEFLGIEQVRILKVSKKVFLFFWGGLLE